MKVLIMRCSDEKFWYKGMIGKSFNVIEHSEEKFRVNDRKSIAKLILKKDVEVTKR